MHLAVSRISRRAYFSYKKERKKENGEKHRPFLYCDHFFCLFHSLYLHISKTGDGGNSVVADALWKVSQKELVSKKKHKVQKK